MCGGISRIAVVLAIVSGCWIAAGCSGETSDPDGGAGSGGAGGSGSMTDSGGDGTTGTVGCLNMDMVPTACPTPPVTYGTVQPILLKRCVSVCHNGTTPDPNDPSMKIWPFSDYAHVNEWRATMRDTVANCSMPPADAGVPVTIEERIAILEFIRCGLPQ